MSKEIISDNLERISKIADTDEPDAGHGYPLIKLLANQTIDLLKQQPECKTCGETKQVRKNMPYCLIPRGMDDYWFKFCDTEKAKDECEECPEHKNNKHLIEYIPCPDCQQPTAGDFTTRLRSFVNMYKNEIPRRAEITLLEESCAELKAKDEIIFAYESVNAPINPLLDINKDLLDACEKALEFIGRSNKTDWNNEITPILEAAIAKAEG